MNILWHLLKIAYLLAWLLLLVHCLKRKRFFPLLGPGWSTKIIWLITFAFFNPLLTLLYVIFAVALKPPAPDTNLRRARIASALASILIALILIFFEMPAFGSGQGPVTIEKRADGVPTAKDRSLLNLEAQGGVLQAQNNFSTSTFSSNSPNDRLSARTVIIRCENDHPLLDRIAGILQQDLAAQPYVHQIIYYPADEETPTNQTLPDIFISLDLPRIKENKSPIGRKLDATITCYASTSLNQGTSHTSYTNSPPRLRFGINSTLQHRSNFNGIESRQARYKQQAQNIAGQISESLTKQFDKWIEKHGLTPELPDFLYGREMIGPDFPFADREFAYKIASGPGLLLNNHSSWIFKDDRPTLDVLKDCRDQLKALGWTGGQHLDKESKHKPDNLTMTKGDKHITVFRKRRRNRHVGTVIIEKKPEAPKPMPLVVRYESLFTNQQSAEAMDKLLAADIDTDILLIFQEFFHTPEQKQQLFSRLQNQQATSMSGALALARLYHRNDEPEKAKESLLLARALAFAEKQHNPRPNEVKQIAKDLEDESLAKQDLQLDHFLQACFIDLAPLTEPLTIEIDIDQAAKFCLLDKDAKIKTVTLRIYPLAASGRPKDTQQKYQLEKTEKTSNSTSTGSSGILPTTATTYVPGYSALQFKIDLAAKNKFQITVPPPRKLNNNQ